MFMQKDLFNIQLFVKLLILLTFLKVILCIKVKHLLHAAPLITYSLFSHWMEKQLWEPLPPAPVNNIQWEESGVKGALYDNGHTQSRLGSEHGISDPGASSLLCRHSTGGGAQSTGARPQKRRMIQAVLCKKSIKCLRFKKMHLESLTYKYLGIRDYALCH